MGTDKEILKVTGKASFLTKDFHEILRKKKQHISKERGLNLGGVNAGKVRASDQKHQTSRNLKRNRNGSKLNLMNTQGYPLRTLRPQQEILQK